MYVELIKFRIKVCKKYYLHLEEQLSKYITERFKYDTLIYNNCIWFHNRDVCEHLEYDQNILRRLLCIHLSHLAHFCVVTCKADFCICYAFLKVVYCTKVSEWELKEVDTMLINNNKHVYIFHTIFSPFSLVLIISIYISLVNTFNYVQVKSWQLITR